MYATGGSTKQVGLYRIHWFTGNGTFTVTEGGEFQYLIVAGGGGGGRDNGGGGGGGGVVYEPSATLSAQAYSVVIGGGGAGSTGANNGANGGNSSFNGMTAIGGGGGGYVNGNGSNGGCGGGGGGTGTKSGGTATQTPPSGAFGHGFNGGGRSGTSYAGGGGGGSGAVGVAGVNATAGAGGNGHRSSITGDLTYYSGGGGGGGDSSYGAGGSGGGGSGSSGAGVAGIAGTANTGGGGGGGSGNNGNGGNGGSGMVIIRYFYDSSGLLKNTGSRLSKYRHSRIADFYPKLKRIKNSSLFTDASLWGYWELNGNANSSINTNNGSENEITYPTTDAYWDSPAKFNGYASRIQVSNLTHGTNNFTYSWWVKWCAPPTPYTHSYFENGSWSNSLIIRQETANLLNIYSMNTSVGSFNFSPIVGSWYHLAIVRNGTSIYLYVNGVLSGSLAFNINVQPSANMWFGASQHSPTQCINAYMSDVAIFTRALTNGEIRGISDGEQINNLDKIHRLELPVVEPELKIDELTSPLELSGCRLWIDISQLSGYSDGQGISAITDLSGHGNNLSQVSVGQNPKYYGNVLNGLATMRGTAAASTTWNIPWGYGAPSTLFYVVRKTSVGGRVLAGKANNFLMGYWSNYKQQAYYEGWIGANSDVANETGFHVVTGQMSVATPAGYSYLFEDGRVVKFGNGGVTAPSGLCIGYTGTSEFSDHDIGEIIGYNRQLTSQERESVENYLLKKWGMDYNVALNKPVYLSWGGTHWYPTDGSSWTDYYIGVTGSSNITVDLLKAYTVSQVDIFHYWWDGRTYYFNKIDISLDGVNWTTIFDSEANGRYAETYKGKTISFSPTGVRYVRNYLNGSSANTDSHWTEIRVIGK